MIEPFSQPYSSTQHAGQLPKFDDTIRVAGAIWGNHQVACSFGVFSAIFNNVEFSLAMMLARFMDDDEDLCKQTWALLEKNPRMSDRIEMVRKEGRKKLSKEKQDRLEVIIEKIKSVVEFRNSLSHGIWTLCDDGAIVSHRGKDLRVNAGMIDDNTKLVMEINGATADFLDLTIEPMTS